jgi:hypothetical protein
MASHGAGVLEDVKISVKLKLSALWAGMMFLYVYADVLSLFRPGQLDEVMRGLMGPFRVSQVSLLIASVVVIVPAIMIALSLILEPAANRRANVVLGALFTLINIGNLIGETWIYYLLFGTLEIVLTSLIVLYAWKWPKAQQ